MSKPTREQFYDYLRGNLDGQDTTTEAATKCESISDTQSIEFAKWLKKGMWTRFGSDESVEHIHPNNRDDDRYRFNGLWYNTTSIALMDNPLTTAELLNQFKAEHFK